jgi:hypothetical protein
MRSWKLLTTAFFLFGCSAATHAQGISNARDGNGNLVDRGAATRTTPPAPMTNSAIQPTPPPVNVLRGSQRVIIIRPRQ